MRFPKREIGETYLNSIMGGCSIGNWEEYWPERLRERTEQ